MPVWRKGSLFENPYYRNAFRIARLPREITRHSTVVKIIQQTGQIIQSDPRAHVVAGKPVTASELNTAQQTLHDVQSRMEEELLAHAMETLPLAGLRKLGTEAAGVMESWGRPPEIADFSFLKPWARELEHEALEGIVKGWSAAGAADIEAFLPMSATSCRESKERTS